jgi:glycogen synthase
VLELHYRLPGTRVFDRPLIGTISRMVGQKGLDLMAALEALERAVMPFQNEPKRTHIPAHGNEQDFSWDRWARGYVRVYDRAIGQATVTAPVAP